MAFFKWFDRIAILQAQDDSSGPMALPPFDFAQLKPRTIGEKLASALGGLAFQHIIPPVLRLCQRFWPLPALAFLNLVIVTRDADVRAVLDDADSFGVPYGPEMKDLGDGTTFGLGLDGPGHARQRDIMQAVMWRDDTGQAYFGDDLDRVLHATARFARGLLENGAGRIDVIRDYVTRIATETAALHFGLYIDDPDGFAEWSLAASCMLFGDPGGSRLTRDVALNGAARLRLVLHKSLARAQRNRAHHPDSGGQNATIIDRLVALQHARRDSDDPITDDDIIALLMGMVTGFVPTNTLAGAKMLAELLARPDALAQARAAAVAGERDALRAILKEAARFNSALAPGQWRVARKDAWIAQGTGHRRFVKKGTVVMVSTMTALRDPRRFVDPSRFRPDRPVEGDLMFGWGPHACMGAHMAIEQITTMFEILFAQPNLQRAQGASGRMEYTGVFPVRLDMTYDNAAATQSMFLVVAPVSPALASTKEAIDAQLHAMGNPAASDLRKLFDSTGIVHFASLSTVQSERGLDIVGEFTVDGEIAPALSKISAATEGTLRPIFALAGLTDTEPLADFLFRKVEPIHSAPWGATGLNYNGTAEFSVRAIAQQRVLAAHAEAILQDHLGRSIGSGGNAMQALTYVRRIIQGDRYHRLLQHTRRARLIEEAEEAELDAFLLKPSRSTLQLADYQQPSRWGAFFGFLRARDGLVITLPLSALLVGCGLALARLVPAPGWPCPPLSEWLSAALQSRCLPIDWDWLNRAAWSLGLIVAGSLIAATAFVVLVITWLIWLLRQHERADKPDPRQASLADLEAIVAAEDRPGYAQNHFMAIGELKPGLFRTLVHAFALWAIRMTITYFYRPGFVINMGTIHAARWWRLPGTRTAIFYANYDGSWESYLEDFITRVSWGQTAAWSNWVGFPETRFLVLKGAENGARFKRWVRTQQHIAPFWYTRFADLTTDQIRTNALIHHGLARARSDSEAREWLRCFGSMPRVENRIETDEVQSIIFRGMGPLKYSTCLALRLPRMDDGKLAAWLASITGLEPDPAATSDPDALRTAFPDAFVSPQSRRLNPHLCISFGDRQVTGEENPDVKANLKLFADDESHDGERQGKLIRQHAVVFGCAAAGFRQLARAQDSRSGMLADDLPGSFPPAFQMGMARRAQVLGDHGDAGPAKWRWADAEPVGTAISAPGPKTTEAVLILYAATPDQLEVIAAFHSELLVHHGGSVLCHRDCAPAEAGAAYDHFGFRDGLSQPVIRGTERFARGTSSRDMVAAGEFILGYPDNQGFFALSPQVRSEADQFESLPLATEDVPSRFPNFGAGTSAGQPRDFGRNGCYMVIREIEQHVETFDAFARRKANELKGLARGEPAQNQYPALFRQAGQDPDAEWVKAKIVGRWKDGRPLVGNPVPARQTKGPAMSDARVISVISSQRAELDNDFAYGIDDPQGFACPFGAHIRRANPRDSKEPGDPTEQMITNRHRLLRRGRSYQDGEEKGLLFVALCADIERQFEFVQQSWINAPAFHGLANEPDPLIGADLATGDQASRVFTIPTPAGPIKLSGMESFTTVRGGGYFFLPSQSAMRFLANLSSRR